MDPILAKERQKWYNHRMQFKVPQDVLRPDKIVSILTLRQLIICTLGGSIAYALYTILARQYFIEVWLIPVVFIALVTLSFAFIRFHDIAFEKLILIFIEYNFKPRKRFWQKMQGDVLFSCLINIKKHESIAIIHQDEMANRREKLAKISTVVDSHGERMTHSFDK